MRHGCRQFLDRQRGELLVGKSEAEHPVGGAQQQVVVRVAHQCDNSLRRGRFWERIAHHTRAVVATQSVVGSHPDESAVVLDNSSYGIRQQSVVHGQLTLTIVGLCVRDKTECQQRKQEVNAFHTTNLRKKTLKRVRY